MGLGLPVACSSTVTQLSRHLSLSPDTVSGVSVQVTTPMNIMGNTFELRDGQGSQGSQQLYPNTPTWTPADATPTGSWMERGSYMSTGRYGGGRLSYVPPPTASSTRSRSRRHRASTPNIQMVSLPRRTLSPPHAQAQHRPQSRPPGPGPSPVTLAAPFPPPSAPATPLHPQRRSHLQFPASLRSFASCHGPL